MDTLHTGHMGPVRRYMFLRDRGQITEIILCLPETQKLYFTVTNYKS
jgi:hypothetical protein